MIFQTTKSHRKILLSFLEGLTPEQLFLIPKGFKNNIIWNIGHILITEQMLTYGLSNLEIPVDNKFVKMYAKGTIPSGKVSKEEINAIKSELLNAIKQTKTDLENGVFKSYNKYETSINVTLNNVEEALQFNLFHEGIHLGVILSLKKLVV